MARAGKQHRREKHVAGAARRKHPEHADAHATFWDRLSGRTQHLVCLLTLLVIALAFFAPVIFSDKALFASDIVSWRAMAEYMVQYEQETGDEALWAPNAFAGMPGYTVNYDPQVPQLDDVATLLRRFMWPASHFIVLLVGVYLLIWYLTRSKLSGMLAAVAYGFTTYIILLLVAGHNTKYIALAYAPWLLLAFAYAIRNPRPLSALLFAAALALNLRAGHVQITYYLAFLLGIWWIVELAGAARHGRIKPFGITTAWLALGTVLAVLMVAQPYLLLAEYREFSSRGGGAVEGGGVGLDWAYAMNWSQGIAELTTLVVAHAFGGAAPTYWGPKPFTAGPHYVGGIVAALAILALWRVRRNAVYGLGIAAFVLILFALGENFPLVNRPMYEFFPLFSAFRAPETWLSVVALALAALAGIGLARLSRHEASDEEENRNGKPAFVALGGVAGLVLLLLVTNGLYLDFERPGELAQVQQLAARQFQLPAESPEVVAAARNYIEEIRPQRAEAFRSDAYRTLFFLALAVLAVILYQRRFIPAWALQSALVLLVLADLWGVGRRYFNETRLVESETLEAQIPTYDFDQFVIDRQQEAGGAGHFRVLSLETQAPTQNARPSYHFESLGGYSAAKLQLFQAFIDNVLFDPQTGLPNPKALDLLNTRYVLVPGTLPGMNLVYRSEQTGMLVLENPDAVPRAFFVGETEVVPSPEETWARLRSEAFDPREVALLPEPIDFRTTPLDSANVASVRLESYSPHEIVWEVETDAPRLLVASEIFYPAGWHAYVDGEETPIYRADYLLRAVPVPEGRHTVVMRFEPASQRIAFWASALSTLAVYGGILALVGLSLYRRRERVHVEEKEGGITSE